MWKRLPDERRWTMVSWGGFGFGIWRTEMLHGRNEIWTFALGPFTWHVSVWWKQAPSNASLEGRGAGFSAERPSRSDCSTESGD